MLSLAGGWELAMTSCVKTAWKKFKELLPVLSSRHLSKTPWLCVQLMCRECDASCKRDLALDKAISTALTAQRLSHDQTDLQCKARGLATVRSNELLARLEIDDLNVILREKRLCWFGQVDNPVAQLRQLATCR